jgi:hypothetical protein
MLTIFSCPKPFTNPHINIIQRNAIKSWTLLQPRPEIILIGDEEGYAEVCKEFGLRHMPEVERNEYGTPLLNSIFNIGQSIASYLLVCYVNADIIFLNDLIYTIKKVEQYFQNNRFLIAGRRWDVDIKTDLDFGISNWNERLKNHAFSIGTINRFGAIDYYIFPKGTLVNIPPFAVGRCNWDNWLLFRVRDLDLPLIDASNSITAIHQNHDYAHTPFNKKGLTSMIIGPEVINNQKLCKGNSRFFTLLDSTHVVTETGLKKIGFKRILHRYGLRLKMYMWYIIAEVLYPYSYPLILLIKMIKRYQSSRQ